MAKQGGLIAYLLVLGILSLGAGVGLLVFEVLQFLRPVSQSTVFNEATLASRPRYQIYASMSLASLCVIIAAGAIVCVFVKSQGLITAFVVIVTVDFIVRVLLLGVLIVACFRTVNTTGEAMKKVFPTYGNMLVRASVEFTAAVNTYSTKESCCGWGVDVDENVYLDTDWYKSINSSTDPIGQITQTLPESCCPSRPSISSIELCTRTASMVAARVDGMINKKSCLITFVDALRKTFFLLIGLHALLVIINAQLAFAFMNFLKRVTMEAEDDEDDSNSSPSVYETKASARRTNGASEYQDYDEYEYDDDDDEEYLKRKKSKPKEDKRLKEEKKSKEKQPKEKQPKEIQPKEKEPKEIIKLREKQMKRNK